MTNYLELMKRSLMDLIYNHDPDRAMEHKLLGLYMPSKAFTMLGKYRLENIEFCVEDVIKNGIPGDMIEAGVWRGGATIFMRAVLKELGVTDRAVWVADSFQGLPPPNPEKYPKDVFQNVKLWEDERLAVSLEEVKSNFERYELLDDQVRFLPGWFRDTMPDNPIQQLAVMRLDGDHYEATWECLLYLYPKLSIGGWCLIDDWYAMRQATEAVKDYREKYGIEDEIIDVTDSRAPGVYWQKASEPYCLEEEES